MDALSTVLRTMRLNGGVYLDGEFSEPWCISSRVKPRDCAGFLDETTHIIPYHYVLEGRLLIRMASGRELAAETGESVLFPRNDAHLLGSDLSLPAVDAHDVVQRAGPGDFYRIVLGGKGAVTRTVCGYLATENVGCNPVLAALPEVLKVGAGPNGSTDWIRNNFRFAATEIAAGRMGAQVVMAKLSELLLVQAIRDYAESLPGEQAGWLVGLKDPYVSRAMALLHERADKPWTVDELARRVGLSRSALNDRFVRILGVPPMQYLASWRIHKAGHELLSSAKSILQIAREVGYDSEPAFTRAFKRIMGEPPACWRRRREPEAA